MSGGRPSLWEDRFIPLALAQALLNKTNPQIAEALGIAPTTLKRWMKERPEFRAAINRGKSEADGRVAATLYECAQGFFREVEKVKILANGRVIRVKEKRYFPPDVSAQRHWLRNRQPELWSNAERSIDADPIDAARELRAQLAAMNKADGFSELAAFAHMPVEPEGTP